VTDTKISPFHAVVTHGVKAILAAIQHRHLFCEVIIIITDASSQRLLLATQKINTVVTVY
jgi:hypothetical protein